MEEEKKQEILFQDEETIKKDRPVIETNKIKFGQGRTFYNGLEITDYFKKIDTNQQDLLVKIDFLNNKIAELEQKSVSNEIKGNKKLEGV